MPDKVCRNDLIVFEMSGGHTVADVGSDELRVVLTSPTARAPTKGSVLAAGYDLYAAQPCDIAPGGKGVVPTDIRVELPPGTYGRIAPRSGLAVHAHIQVGAGVVDRDYTGNLGVVLFNHSPHLFRVETGDRIAQLICERIAEPQLVVVSSVADTGRGAGGFGSTGRN